MIPSCYYLEIIVRFSKLACTKHVQSHSCNGRLWNPRWQQTYQVNVHCLRKYEHANISREQGIYLVSLLPPGVPKSLTLLNEIILSMYLKSFWPKIIIATPPPYQVCCLFVCFCHSEALNHLVISSSHPPPCINHKWSVTIEYVPCFRPFSKTTASAYPLSACLKCGTKITHFQIKLTRV